jgi:hypothetical protein
VTGFADEPRVFDDSLSAKRMRQRKMIAFRLRDLDLPATHFAFTHRTVVDDPALLVVEQALWVQSNTDILDYLRAPLAVVLCDIGPGS